MDCQNNLNSKQNMKQYQSKPRKQFTGKRNFSSQNRSPRGNYNDKPKRQFNGKRNSSSQGRDFKPRYDNKPRYESKPKRQFASKRNFSSQSHDANNKYDNKPKRQFTGKKNFTSQNRETHQKFENKTKKITKTPGTPQAPAASLQHLPTIQQLLDIPQQQRLNKSTSIFEQVRPFLTSFIQKKQGSRVTQLLFKWGNLDTRTIIYKEIIKSWKELIKSPYALFMIAKVSKEFQLPGLVQDLQLLQNNRQGAQILQNFIHSSPESQTVKKLKQKITELNEKSKIATQIKAQQTLDNMATRSIEKQYYWFQLSKIILRLRLPSMFEEQKQKAIQLLTANCASIVNDEQGVRLFIELLNNCSSKDKKNIIKQYKGHLDEIVKANNVSYVTVIKLIIDTDDTVLIIKSFEEELLALIPQIIQCRKAFSIFFALFSPRNNNFNILGKYEPHVERTTCKKPEEQRKKELREFLYHPLMDLLKNEETLHLLIKNPVESKLIVGLEKSMQQDHHTSYQPFVTLILQYFLKVANETLTANTFHESILSDGNASKVLKSLLLIQQPFIDFYCDEFAKLFIKHLKTVLESRASFILLGILEKGGRDHLVKEIVKSGVGFDKCIAGQHFLKLINGSTGKEFQQQQPHGQKKYDGKKK